MPCPLQMCSQLFASSSAAPRGLPGVRPALRQIPGGCSFIHPAALGHGVSGLLRPEAPGQAQTGERLRPAPSAASTGTAFGPSRRDSGIPLHRVLYAQTRGVVFASPGAWSLGGTALTVPLRRQKPGRGSCQKRQSGVRGRSSCGAAGSVWLGGARAGRGSGSGWAGIWLRLGGVRALGGRGSASVNVRGGVPQAGVEAVRAVGEAGSLGKS